MGSCAWIFSLDIHLQVYLNHLLPYYLKGKVVEEPGFFKSQLPCLQSWLTADYHQHKTEPELGYRLMHTHRLRDWAQLSLYLQYGGKWKLYKWKMALSDEVAKALNVSAFSNYLSFPL